MISDAMPRATVLTLTNTEATSEVVTSPASSGCMPCRNTGSAYRLFMEGWRNLAATPISPRAMPSGAQSAVA